MPHTGNKRTRKVVDLTQDNGAQQRPAKRPATTAHSYSASQYRASSSSSTPASSQQPSVQSSQATPSPASNLHASDEPEYYDLTQEEEPPRYELYGTYDGRVVGCQYYNGWASTGEAVLCRREPNNQYDDNAIRVDNVLRRQIGHLPRKLVEKLAPYVDSGDITLEARLRGPKDTFDCPIRLVLFGLSDPKQRDRIEKRLKADKLVKVTELQKTKKMAESQRIAMGLKNGSSTIGVGVGVDGASMLGQSSLSLDDLLKKSESVDSSRHLDTIRTLAVGENELSGMSYAEQPAQLISTLLPYQLQGLAWMTRKEHASPPANEFEKPVQLWGRTKQGMYMNLASGFATQSPPVLCSGGILADDMGLGKTLQMISLILTGGPGSTLIVAPVSVMSNWRQQIERHVKPEQAPSVVLYHGDNRMTAEELRRHQVVITSYGRLMREADPKSPRVLLKKSTPWRRVILDEGHTIRNAKTKVALAACELQAQSRWILSGTPIINSIKDLQSMVKFLHLTGGIEQPEIFNTAVTRRMAAGDRGGELILQALMQDICLRRRKDMKFVNLNLPAKKEFLHRIAFHPTEKEKYDALLSEARGALEDFQSKTALQQGGRFQNVLERLLRLRQTCNHWTLCKKRVDDLMRLLNEDKVVPFTAENRALLQQALTLYLESQEDCAICCDTPKGPVITNCKHVFCHVCISKAIQIQHRCPMCRNELTQDCLLEPALEGASDDNFDTESQSSKTDAILHIARATIQKPGSKIIIFSQWTSFLNIVQNQLKLAGLKVSRIDGSMNADKRDRAIEALDHDPDTRVLLASLAVCSVGLNLTAADTVILSDSWWAPAIEDQAIDRVHRLGQTRETTVWRLIMEGSVEERVLDIQKLKRELIGKAFQEKGDKETRARETRMADVKKLLY